jgi:hypothetical protein
MSIRPLCSRRAAMGQASGTSIPQTIAVREHVSPLSAGLSRTQPPFVYR